MARVTPNLGIWTTAMDPVGGWLRPWSGVWAQWGQGTRTTSSFLGCQRAHPEAVVDGMAKGQGLVPAAPGSVPALAYHGCIDSSTVICGPRICFTPGQLRIELP